MGQACSLKLCNGNDYFIKYYNDFLSLTKVLTQMPKKQMHIEHVPLSSDQRELYDKLKKKFCEEVRDVSDHPKRGGASMLMELRKAANHHLLLREKYDDKKLKQMAKQILKVRLKVVFVARYRPRNYDFCFLLMCLIASCRNQPILNATNNSYLKTCRS